ncbi:MAG: SGNH/GDSL hydrolase family protein [Bacteroidales bacterium]|nr:SGNH/GDSL hydrolase family protein [Bacteroidales bacterium]
MNSSVDFDKNSHFLGYYYGVGELLSLNFAPQPGMFFVNGETNSVWVWDALTRMWIDSNRVDSGLKGMLTDEEGNSPVDYVPSPKVGVKESYFYVAGCDDANPKTVTFTYFKNGASSVSVTINNTSIVYLYWNGDYWECDTIPMFVDNVSQCASKGEFEEFKNSVQQFVFSGNETVNKFFKELYVVPTKEGFSIEELYVNSIARNYPHSTGNYWGINFVRKGGEKPLYFLSYDNPESVDVLEVDLYEDGFGVAAKMYAVVDWSAIEENTIFSTGLNISLKYWNEIKYSPYISAYINSQNGENKSEVFIDSNNYANLFKELYISSFENKIYQLKEGNNVSTYLEDIPKESINLRIMSVTRNVVSQSSGENYWSVMFKISAPMYEVRDGKYYIVRDAEGNVQYSKDTNFHFDLFEEKRGVIDETISLDIVLFEENGKDYHAFTYRLKLYAVIDWDLMNEGASVYFYPRNVLPAAYDVNNSPQIKEYIKNKESYLPIKIGAKSTFNLTSENRIVLYGASLCSDYYPWFKEWLEKYTGAEVINSGNPGWNVKQLASTDYYNKVKSLDADVVYVMLGGNDNGKEVGTFGEVETQPLVDEIPLTESWSNAESNNKGYKFIQCLDYILRKLKAEYYNVQDNEKTDKRFPYIVVGTFPSQHREGWQFTEFNIPQNWLNKRNAIVECANRNNLPCIDVFSEIGIDWDKEPYYNQDFDYNASTGKPTLVNRGIYTLDGLHLNEYGFERIARLLSCALLPSNSGLKTIVWSESFNLDDYKTQGIYYITGERLLSEYDNLPIMNASPGHTISGQLTVLDASLSDAEMCVTQYLKLTNRLGSEGKEYVRTYNKYSNGTKGWSVWREIKQTANLNQISDAELKNYTENGLYEGVIFEGLTISGSTMAQFLSEIKQTTGSASIPNGSLFSMEVFNNYAIVDFALANGVTLHKSITQKAKVLIVNGTYVEIQRTLQNDVWSNWKMINI